MDEYSKPIANLLWAKKKKVGKNTNPSTPFSNLYVDFSEAMIKFREDLEKYHKISRKEREDTLKEEKKQLTEQEKSPRIKYYDGTKADRIKQVDLEIEILAQMEKLASSKELDD